MTGPVRLQKVLAAAGVASRRGAEELITAGRVTVDGRVASLGESVEEGTVLIAVDGRPIGSPTSEVYLACHKPAGVTSTVRDRHAASTVIDLVPAALRPGGGRLVPIGRLDKDSEGLILLTSDGDWSERVLHPRFGVEREYAVGVRWPLDHDGEGALRHGIALEEGRARLVSMRHQRAAETDSLLALVGRGMDDQPLTWYRVTLRTGWKRQIRRMFAAVGDPVVRLVRVRVGSVDLGTLAAGACRSLTPGDVRAIGVGARRTPGTRRTPGARRPPGTRSGPAAPRE
jgi:pseudouridine synthase